MTEVIGVRGLVRSFGRRRALDGLDLVAEQGEVHGFIGPNGAGKSTTIRILLGSLRPQGGSARVFGLDPWQEAPRVHRRLAAVPGDVVLWPNLTGGETVDLLTRLRGGADPVLRARLLDDFALDPRVRCGAYSKGNRQKVALVAAFARRADLYLLDEPTTGLDPVVEEAFRAEVRRVKAEGAAVLLSSHVLAQVEQLADRITIVRAGRAVETGSLDDLRHLTRTRYRVVTDLRPEEVGAIDGVHDAAARDGVLVFDVDDAATARVLTRLAAARVTSLTAEPPSLEALLLQHEGSRA